VAAAELGVEVVPVPVTIDGEPFDGAHDTFYARMAAGAVATTSQPSPGAFLAAYERASARGSTSVLSLHLDSRVSGVSASADLAARETPLRVLVADLPTVSYGVALCLRAASSALARGADVDGACLDARRLAAALENLFVARSAPGGRVSASEEWTLLRFADGEAQHVASHETMTAAASDMTRRILLSPPISAAVGHAGPDVEAVADRLAHDLLRERVEGVERYRVSPSVGAHTGPDSFGAFWQRS
jgi:DegV family protein with EDD domain